METDTIVIIVLVAVILAVVITKEHFTLHPVLRYQLDKAEKTGIVEPANYGDSIRVADIAGPVSSGNLGYPIVTPSSMEANYLANLPMKVPVPVGSLKNMFGLPIFDRGWRKIGIMTRGSDIMNLFARPVVPSQDLWEYKCQDRDGFSIPLQNTFIDNNDVIRNIPGKEGDWKVTTFTPRRYAWV